jgi:aryl-alcohol dehydrogenase-like predicted oxidoreductase
MYTVTIPTTDLRVSSLCLGTAEFGAVVAKADAFRLLDAFVDAGGTFIDTANVYADWIPGAKSSSEKFIGEWLAQRGLRSRIILATKGAHPPLANMQQGRLRPLDIVHDLEQSLGHLHTDAVDLYWLHRDDPSQPVEQIVETLAAQIRAGKVRAWGVSNWRTERIAAAQRYAAKASLPVLAANQPQWSLAVLDAEAIADKTIVAMDVGMHAYHTRTGLTCIPFSSQGKGILHKLAAGAPERIRAGQTQVYPLAANQVRAAAAQRLADELGVSLTGVVLGYLQSQPFVTVPIVGPTTVDQLQDSVAGDSVRLTPEQIAALDAAR